MSGAPRRLRVLARGLGFTEGPVWTVDGRLLLVSVNRGRIYEAFLDSSDPRQIAETGGGPNGLACDADGDVWICQNGGLAMRTKSRIRRGPSIQVLRPGTGEVVTAAAGPFSSPSDCAMGPDGRLWFTDPRNHHLDDRAEPGRVWALDIRTMRAEPVLDGILFPNGLAFGDGGAVLYVAESATGRVLRFSESSAGWTRDPWVAHLPRGVPDGLAVDVDGHVWVVGSFSGDVVRFTGDGRPAETIELGSGFMPTSLCYAGAELDQMVITSARGGCVVSWQATIRGMPLFTESATERTA
ncbi:SMP-30/gluconolactonase/LRE family protein [Nonomuraea lactucae]|uniref:SMP-30/gluconolactonase/LRE family protein n=1 Tax=Nonomuraea lactucae TaxID=2249762 RepID=UPI0013B44236|nr:SMP-30/gluconolactonase/LRE family protein [Nonomuraea lactucae]